MAKKCSLYTPEEEDLKHRSELITDIKKKKGIKGNVQAVRYQEFLWNNELNCLFLSGGLKNYMLGYNRGFMIGWICVDEEKYFTKDKIKKITKSLGVYNIEDPPSYLRLEFNKN